ncbi:MAG TPA: hypothetical protein VFJ29_06275, partial [Candidatus Kapabacteria bacterium]|nr:hypothetical protein [Candidatus Kapabacteria bacterium]
MRTKVIVVSVFSAVITAIIVSCTTTVDTNPVRFGGQKYRPPTAVRALGAEGSVIIAWVPSLDIDSSAFQGYSFTCLVHDTNATHGVDTLTNLDVSRTDSSYQFLGLTDGVIDTIFIQSVALDGTRGLASEKILCAAARQATRIQLWGFSASDTVMRGLKIFPDSIGAVYAPANADSVDLVFDDAGGAYHLVSANLRSGGALVMPRQTLLDPAKTQYVTNLNDAALADSVADTLSNLAQANAALGAGGNGISGNGKGEAFFIKTQDGNYARIFIHAVDSLGTLYAKDTVTG